MKIEVNQRVKDIIENEEERNRYQRRALEIEKIGVKGKNLINFQIGDPVRGGLMTPDFVNDELIHTAHGRWNAYSSYAGTKHGEQPSNPVGKHLREAIVHRENRVHNISYPVDNVFITCAGMGAIRTLLWVLMNPEDEWLVLEPIYENYLWTHAFYPFKWVPWKSDEEQGWKPDLDELRSKITEKTKGILMVSPNNPTGAVYDHKILKGIADIAGEHDLLIMSDEVMDLLCHNGELATSIANVAGDVPCFKIDSFAKGMLAPGWNIGWILLHDPEGKVENLKSGIRTVVSSTGSAPTPICVAAASVLERTTNFQRHLTYAIEVLKERCAYVMKRVEEIEGISMVKPKAGYWGFPKVEGIGRIWKDDSEFAWQLLEEEAISIIRGEYWGPTYGTGHFRATLLEPIHVLEEGFNRIDSFIRRHCK